MLLVVADFVLKEVTMKKKNLLDFSVFTFYCQFFSLSHVPVVNLAGNVMLTLRKPLRRLIGSVHIDIGWPVLMVRCRPRCQFAGPGKKVLDFTNRL